jgi:hypothetical protein
VVPDIIHFSGLTKPLLIVIINASYQFIHDVMKHLTLLMIALLSAATVLGQTECPFGLTNDPAPGQCGRYTYADGNGICDLSQPPPDTQPGASLGVEPAPEPHHQPEMSEDELEAACQPINSYGVEASEESSDDSAKPAPPIGSPLPNPTVRTDRQNHHPWLLLAIVGTLILAGELWQKKDSSKLVPLQAFWNWLLLGLFLASSLTGLRFILPPGSRPGPYYLHTISSLLFIYVALYHVIRRCACLIRGPRACCKQNPCC